MQQSSFADLECIEHQAKKQRQDSDYEELKKIIISMHQRILNRLKHIEDKIDKLCSRYHLLERKVERILAKVKDPDFVLPSNPKITSSSNGQRPNGIETDSCGQRLDLYPDGSFLGDPDNPDLRVRCSITPRELEKINGMWKTPDRMCLTLLEHLFDRETLACSNVSGTGILGKALLDPIKIHGIKYHLIYKYGLTDKEWEKMKKVIDSTCRCYFRKKHSGLPLQPRHEHQYKISNLESSLSGTLNEKKSQGSITPSSSSGVNLKHLLQANSLSPISFINKFENSIVQTKHGNFQVIKATEEHIQQLLKMQDIKIVTNTKT